MLLWPALAVAQDDRGRLQAFLEDNLSDAGRTVRIVGFAGALSARATLEELSIADETGTWLILRDVALSWRRAALLRGRLEVEELSAAELILPRLPASEDSGPDPEASGFSGIALPELPVAINIGRLEIARAEIGAPVLGQAAQMRLSGRAELADGTGSALLDLRRTDGAQGVIRLEAALANATGALRLDLSATEGPGGILTNLIGLPGAPSLDLSVAGDGFVQDFTADIALETDGAPRLSGQARLSGDETERRLGLDVSGDIRPLLDPQHRAFFGARTALVLDSVAREDGGLSLETLRADAAAFALEGALSVAPDGWPEAFDLRVDLSPPEGDRLTLPGSDLSTTGGVVDLSFDAADGDQWRGRGHLNDLDLPGAPMERAGFDATGTISRDTAGALGRASGDMTLDLTGVSLPDPGLQQAVGSRIRGQLGFDYASRQPFVLRDLALDIAGGRLTGRADIAGLLEGLNPRVTAELQIEAPDMGLWSGVAGRPLQGAAQFDLGGEGAPLAGIFDVNFNGTTQDLTLGIAEADRLLTGPVLLSGGLRRDTSGTTLTPTRITLNGAEITADGTLRTGASLLDLRLNLPDVAVVTPALTGPLRSNMRARQSDETWQVTATLDAPGNATGRIALETTLKDAIGPITGSGALTLPDLTTFAALTGLDLSGRAALDVTGAFDPTAGTGSAQITGTTRTLALGIPQADTLLDGAGRLSGQLSGSAEGIEIAALTMATDHARLSTSGTVAPGPRADLKYDLGLTDLARLLENLPGAARATGDITLGDAGLDITTDLTAPGTSRATGQARVTLDDTLRPGAARITANLTSGDLSAFSRLAGRPLAGALEAGVTATGDLSKPSFEADLTLLGTNLRISQPEADRLLRGQTRLRLIANSPETGHYIITRSDLGNDQISADLTGQLTPTNSRAEFDLRLANLAQIVPDLPGILSASGSVAQSDGPWQVDVDLQGPGGTTARAAGTIANTADRATLSVNGALPLALANRFIAPNLAAGTARFDLALNGPLALSSVSGRIQTGGASLALPGQPIGLRDIAATVDLAGNSASLDVTSAISPGGSLRLSGPIALTAPNAAELTLALNSVQVTQPGLLDTTAQGTLRISGPLAGGARISGDIALGPVEMRIAEPVGGSADGLEGLKHEGAPAAVRATQTRAGLRETTSTSASQAAGPGFPLDLTVSAPSQIFVRGRGLDAELGGAVTLRGTTNAIAPDGRFDLIRGRLDILGKRLDLTEGYAQMRGALDPFVRMIAQTQSGDVLVQILVEGPASDPEITVTSTPELPQDEILAKLLFGRDISDITPFQAVRLAAAVATLLGKGGDGIVSRLREGFGLDDLDIVQNEDGTTGVRAGKYISENIYSDVTTSSGGNTEVNLNLDITPNLTLRGSAGSDGGTGIGIFFEKDY